MAYDISDLVVIDPALDGLGVSVAAHRLTQTDQQTSDGRYRYEFVARLERTKRWPKGTYWINFLDADDLLIDNYVFALVKTTVSGVKQGEVAVYASNIGRAELIFEPEDPAPDGDDAEVDDRDGWTDVLVEQDLSEAPGLSLDGVLCQAHDDFEYSNLTLVQFNAAVRRDGTPRFPAEVTARLEVLDSHGRLLLAPSLDLSGGGPKAARSITWSGTVYKHTAPAVVRVHLFAEEEEPGSLPAADLTPGLAPAHGAAITSLLQRVDAKLDDVLEALGRS